MYPQVKTRLDYPASGPYQRRIYILWTWPGTLYCFPCAVVKIRKENYCCRKLYREVHHSMSVSISHLFRPFPSPTMIHCIGMPHSELCRIRFPNLPLSLSCAAMLWVVLCRWSRRCNPIECLCIVTHCDSSLHQLDQLTQRPPEGQGGMGNTCEQRVQRIQLRGDSQAHSREPYYSELTR